MGRRILGILCAMALVVPAQAIEVGHYMPGVANIRDFSSLPWPGCSGIKSRSARPGSSSGHQAQSFVIENPASFGESKNHG